MEILVQSHGLSTAFSLELLSFRKLGSAVSVDFSSMLLTSLVHVFPPPTLQLDSQRSAWCLVVDFCIWFHQLLDEGSMMIVGVFINLITGEGQFRHPLHYC